jgi:hypothetical protein
METEGSLSCTQKPSTCPYPKPDQSNPVQAIPFCCFKIYFLLSFFERLDLASDYFLRASPPKNSECISFFPRPLPLYFIRSPALRVLRGTNREG